MLRLSAVAVSWGEIVALIIVGGVVLVFVVGGLTVLVQSIKSQEHFRKNVDRHRLHAERTEEHMARMENLVERIATALEGQQPSPPDS